MSTTSKQGYRVARTALLVLPGKQVVHPPEPAADATVSLAHGAHAEEFIVENVPTGQVAQAPSGGSALSPAAQSELWHTNAPYDLRLSQMRASRDETTNSRRERTAITWMHRIIVGAVRAYNDCAISSTSVLYHDNATYRQYTFDSLILRYKTPSHNRSCREERTKPFS